MAVEMNKQTLKKMCKDSGLYSTPSVNDKLYLHYKGFRKIENLEEYTNIKALWLEGNGLDKLEGLQNMTQLRSAYLHENLFEAIEGLDTLTELDTLNLSKNFIKKIENLSQCKVLTNLNLAHNALTTVESIQHVLDIPTLQTLDIQSNKIDDPLVVNIFAQMPDLRVLYLQGNPVVKKIPHYRKTIISKCQHLRYLDDRPGILICIMKIVLM
jgi:dynein assembly factor 1